MIYQNLTFEALQHWEQWNSETEHGEDIPPSLSSKDRIYVNNGILHVNDPSKPELSAFERLSIQNITKAGYGHTQYVLSRPGDRLRAKNDGFAYALDPFRKGGEPRGLLDTAGGLVYADKACCFALHKAKRLGAKFVLGGLEGTFSKLQEEKKGGRVTGVRTADGVLHPCELVIMACGGWTPSLIPEMDGLCETTSGSVTFLQIPRHSPLWARFAPENFPVWTVQLRDGELGGVYGFPRDEHGIMKVAYRGTKYTNPQLCEDGSERSAPITKWTTPSIEKIPSEALNVLTEFLDTYLPELGQNNIHISGTRLCWYTDSYDNQYVIDAVPGKQGLMVATGGSGHAFKMLPVIGKHVVDRIEGRSTDELRCWRWRKKGVGEKPFNVLMEGSNGPRALQNVALSGETDLLLRSGGSTAKL